MAVSHLAYNYRSDDGRKYVLRIEYIRSRTSVSIIGAQIFNTKGDYMGYWDNFNMPLALLQDMRKFVKTTSSIPEVNGNPRS
jgi:hypothetical protein